MQHLLLQLKLIKDKTQLQRTLIYNEQNVQSKFNLIHGSAWILQTIWSVRSCSNLECLLSSKPDKFPPTI